MTFTKEQLTRIIESADEVITALAGTNDDIHPDNSTKMCEAWNYLNDVAAPPSVVKRLAEMALVGMEAEPVAWVLIDPESGHSVATKAEFTLNFYRDKGWNIAPLYAAPQPLTTSERAELENYRNAQPDMNYQHLSELYHAQEKRLFKLAQRIKGPAFDKYAHSPSQAIDVLESAIFGEREDEDCRAAMLQGKADGNSPVIPDCSCRTCRPVTMNDMRFVVCPQCGNKRCPHANDCRNACTGSNEPGQEGSAYPAAPQQEAKQ